MTWGTTTLTIVDIFAVSFTDGVMVVANREGAHVRKGDRVWMETDESEALRGEIGMIDHNRPSGSPDTRLGIEIVGPLASTVRVADVVFVEPGVGHE